ncbi:hypothetical protein GCM10023185_10500 [Hymenobacter saemangeumensis]|uniref:AraC family transcriptional regulator n=1 Tax=Hymenobacter saemangeumensis TaxID=1084522 RepID=A0ABP8I575_9BACT
MTRYIFLILILLAIGLAGYYAYLGGFKQPTVMLETQPAPLYLAGQPFKGLATDDKFGPLFRQAKSVQDGGQLKGDLANLYLNNPGSAKDTIQAFIGLAVADTTQPLPPGFRYRVIPAGQRVMTARLEGVSYLLAPAALYPAALKAVQEQKLTQRNFFLERFGAGEKSEVWVGVK